jgi:branched-chain amino acid transport system permease protein
VTVFLTDIVVPGLVAGSVYALIALGFSVLFRTTGVLNFAQGHLVMTGPMLVLVAVELWGWPVVPAFAFGIASVVVTSLIVERVAVRPFIDSGHSMSWILSTLGASVILGELLSIPFSGTAQAFEWGASANGREVLGVSVSPAQIVIVASALLVVLLLHLLSTQTRLGLRLEAMAADQDGAASLGITPSRMSQAAAVLSGLIALVTGMVLAPTLTVSPSLGFAYTFNGFVAAAIGGLGSVPGALAGGMAVGFASQLASVHLGGLYVNLVLFSLLMAIYFVRPHGLFGRAPLRTV